MVDVVARAEQTVLLGVPERQHDRAARRLGEAAQRTPDREDRSDAGRVVRRAVADPPGGSGAAGAHVIVVRADDDDLVGHLPPGDDAEQVRAPFPGLDEGLAVGFGAHSRGIESFGDQPEAGDQVPLHPGSRGRIVVPAVEVVGREPLGDAHEATAGGPAPLVDVVDREGAGGPRDEQGEGRAKRGPEARRRAESETERRGSISSAIILSQPNGPVKPYLGVRNGSEPSGRGDDRAAGWLGRRSPPSLMGRRRQPRGPGGAAEPPWRSPPGPF